MTATTAPARDVLLLARYDVGTGKPGAPLLTLALTFNTVDHMIHGAGYLTQAIDPPLDLRMNVDGNYAQLVMPPLTKIAVSLTGFPAIQWPPHGGIGPVLPPVLQLNMQLDTDFQTGVASYRFRGPNGQWIEVNDQPVRRERI